MPSALVIGGTGPTGPYIVNGLLARGYTVTILHSGTHEVEFDQEVEHIHTDPHFRETLTPPLVGRRWDLVIAGYGRLALTADVMKDHTGRLIALGGSTGYLAGPDDPRWGTIGRPSNLNEEDGLDEANPANKFGYRMAQAQQALFAAHAAGHFNATYVAYPIVHGPRQPGTHDWSIVRRVLDGRKPFIIADGGGKVEDRAFAGNAAHAVLLCVDQPEKSAGQKYLMSDEHLYTMRQRIEAISRHMGHEFEFVDMPYELAVPCHVLWRRGRTSRFRDTSKIRYELGYRDQTSPWDAVRESVDWLLANRPERDGELEHQLGDPFDYVREDRLIAQWRSHIASFPAVDYPLPGYAHMYRHPDKPNEPWSRPK